MSFIETPTFPLCIRLGFTAMPNYSVTISQTVSGRERRNRNWQQSQRIFSVNVGPSDDDLVDELIEFWHAMAGPECGFRFKDWTDFKSCHKRATATPLDQSLELIAGSPGGYQLQKTYRAGTRATVRDILKPVQGTIRIARDGVEIFEGTDWALDYTTGLLTLWNTSGAITWGGEFDVPVRFDSDFPINALSNNIEQVQVQLRELRDPSTED